MSPLRRWRRWGSICLAAFGLCMPGCGHLMVQTVPPCGCDGALLDGVEPACCEASEKITFNRFHDVGAKLQEHRHRTADKLAACSAKVQDRWQNSHWSQWKAQQREKLSAPPYPRFHPIPTHPVFYPEEAMTVEVPSSKPLGPMSAK